MYRIDRPPEATVDVVRRALREADVGEVYVEGNVVMGTIRSPGAVDQPVWVVEVDLGRPPGVAGTLVSVAVRLNDDLSPQADRPEGLDAAPTVGQAVVDALRSLAGSDFYRVPGPEDGAEAPDGWAALGDHEAVTATGMRSLGQAVYEVRRNGRTATARVVRPERHDAGRGVAVSTPLEVARAGTGFECYFDGDDEFTRYDYGAHPVELPDPTWSELRSLRPFGVVVVDDRLGVAEHVLPAVVVDPETVVEHAGAVVALASAVERAVETQV